MTTQVDFYVPSGTRNKIRKGDRVRFQEKPGKAIHEAKVNGIHVNAVSGEVEYVDIIICRQRTDGKIDQHGGKSRMVGPEKISRMSQAKVKRTIG